MCIVVVTTAHPRFPLILASNRDEFLQRPTLRATFWESPNNHVLGGRDLHRAVHGTWLGITKQGRLAILTNFKEDSTAGVEGRRSRGEVPLAFLSLPSDSRETPEEFAQELLGDQGLTGIGGFSLAFCQIKRPKSIMMGDKHVAGAHVDDYHIPNMRTNAKHFECGRIQFGIISSRTQDTSHVAWIDEEIWALSNSSFWDPKWTKVKIAEQEFAKLVLEDSDLSAGPSNIDAESLVKRCFEILHKHTFSANRRQDSFHAIMNDLQDSIFVPKLGKAVENVEQRAQRSVTEGTYGTTQQTVVVVDWEGRVTFVERTLYDPAGRPMADDEKDVKIEFDIIGWNDEN